MIFCVKKIHKYLYGRSFTLVSDHRPLVTILGPTKAVPPLAAARMQHWALILQAYSSSSSSSSSSFPTFMWGRCVL